MALTKPLFASSPPHKGNRAVGRLPMGTMNKMEADYAVELEFQRQTGKILWWKFEALRFRLADNTFYTPDFAVLDENSFIQAHEVKGFWEDYGRVKIKVAAAMFPVQFFGITRIPKKLGGGWKIENFSKGNDDESLAQKP